MLKNIITFFDKLEDKIRIGLSHRPIMYALVGAIGIILLWKGIWEVAGLFPILNGMGSLVLGVLILLSSGLLVSFFIGDSIILSGFKHEKKLTEKTEEEIKKEVNNLQVVITKLDTIEKEITELKESQ